MHELISMVIPCFNEEQNLRPLLNEITHVVANWPNPETETESKPYFEIVLVDDGSTDNSLNIIHAAATSEKYPFKVRYISFSRNFGKEAALYAGIEAAKGTLVATMDADMQDPPSLLPQMYKTLKEEDCDNVATRRATRQGEPPIRSFFARLFYKIINKIADVEIVDGARDFRLMKKQMANAVLNLQERNRFSKGIFEWVGFKTRYISYENIERTAGGTKWSFWQLFVYALDGLAAFSIAPLALASLIGIVLCLIAFIAVLVIFFKTIAFGDPVDGWPSLACIIVFLGGLQLFCIGVIGRYLARVYLEVKHRPIYIARETSEENSL
jgi:glucosyltransferase